MHDAVCMCVVTIYIVQRLNKTFFLPMANSMCRAAIRDIYTVIFAVFTDWKPSAKFRPAKI